MNYNKIKDLIVFLTKCVSLNDVRKSGCDENHLNIKEQKYESLNEHSYMSAMIVKMVYYEILDEKEKNDIDIERVIDMLLFHEIRKIQIGDLTLFDGISSEKKIEMEHEKIQNIVKNLKSGSYIYEVIVEFDSQETKEAKYAYMCHEFQSNLQPELHNEQVKTITLKYQENNFLLKKTKIKEAMNFLTQCSSLNNIQRSGWDKTHWNIKCGKFESINEHIYIVVLIAKMVYHELLDEKEKSINKDIKFDVLDDFIIYAKEKIKEEKQ